MAEIPSILSTIEDIAARFSLCRNRVWEVAKTLEDDERLHLLSIPADVEVSQTGSHKGHDVCTFDFCEHSRLDFTSVMQRHEDCEATECERREFSSLVLENAISERKLTAWKLDGSGALERPRPFMAISHVWSDGTGTGAWAPGEVNSCLYKYFKGIAERFGCEGLWWDTVCIPREKVARSKAIVHMERNYEEAALTLVHDTFLRNWAWINPEVACYAITVSPWFSRGWTALELAMSRKVKVAFRDCIKDLDEDILARVTPSVSRKHLIASGAIQALRIHQVTDVNQLLQVLGARYTSWPRDMALISGQLTRIDVDPRSTQQEIYQQVLRKIGKISQENLFHNSMTMSKGFEWCPTSLYNLRQSTTLSKLSVGHNGNLTGEWRILPIAENLEERYNWKDTHPLVKAKVELALKHPQEHLLLVYEKMITKALVVKVQEIIDKRGRWIFVHYVGPLHFHPPVKRKGSSKERVIIVGDSSDQSNDSASPENERILAEPIRVDVQDDDGNTPLHLFARNGDEERIMTDPLNIDLNLQNKDGMTALHLAAQQGHHMIVRSLLKKGANPNIVDNGSFTPLHIAAWNCHHGPVYTLMECPETDFTLADALGRTPLHLSALRGDLTVTRQLLPRDERYGRRLDSKLRSALHAAAWAGSRDVVEMLLENPFGDFGVNGQDSEKKTPLHTGAEMGHLAVVDLLLKAGAILELQDSMERTALHLAVLNAHDDVVTALIRTQLHIEDRNGLTPLLIAAKHGRVNAFKMLIDGGADIESRGGSGRTPIAWACFGGHEEIVNRLLEAGVYRSSGEGNESPLLLAAQNGHIKIVELLLKKGKINPDLTAGGGRTPLIWASGEGHERIVKVLLDAGADPDIRDGLKQTALILAAKNKHKGVVKLLVEGKANLESEDRLGRTALSWAAGNADATAVKLLLQAGAKADSVDNQGWSPLRIIISEGGGFRDLDIIAKLLIDHSPDLSYVSIDEVMYNAASHGWEETIKVLLDRGADANGTPMKRQGEGTTSRERPLVVAIQKNHLGVAKILLDAGADPDARFNLENSLLTFAAGQANKDLVRWLIEAGASLDFSPFMGRTALFSAAGSTNPNAEKVVKLLLDAGADYSILDEGDQTPLFPAVNSGSVNLAIVQMLIEAGVDVGCRCDDTYNVLEYTVEGGFDEKSKPLIMLLLAHGARPRPQMAEEILHSAVELGWIDLSEAMIDFGADPNLKVEEGMTIFDTATTKGHVDMMRFLLTKGAKLSNSCVLDAYTVYEDPKRLLPAVEFLLRKGGSLERDDAVEMLLIAAENGQETIVRLLVENYKRDSGFIDAVNYSKTSRVKYGGLTPLSLAARRGNAEIVELLLQNGANIEARDDQGLTPAFHAVGSAGVMKLLLEHGAHSDVRDAQGRTPLARAVTGGHKEVVKLLSEGEQVSTTGARI